jgi:methionine sulfoxide reductase heme-binding subunit
MAWVWQDRNGRFSALRAALFAAILAPGLFILGKILTGNLGSEPFTEVEHELGLWTVRLLLTTLAVTPFQRSLGWRGLGSVRRMLGVATACYVLLHLSAYIVDQSFDLVKVATEIVLRFYLLVGITAIIGLVALAVTSTDRMAQRLGRNWSRLHKLVYPIAFLALTHFFIQAKLDITEPTWMAGLFAWLLGWRLLPPLFGRRPPPVWALALLSLGVASLTALAEAFYFHLLTGVGMGMVLGADFSFDTGLRPPMLVLAGGGAVTLAALGRAAWPLLPRLYRIVPQPR